ncbi:hypothetical protein PYW07_011313 [Mythimna separata]|uniref:Ig-like domain-containing protein n=1 Tax=Mythimna separata TaxID=271217 RepID=A0AAD7Y947_MYTSE|nr:hypothetical protein PYW07_011313 [Mythimna separata]
MMVSVRILAFLALAVVGLRADQTSPKTHCIQEDKRLKCKLILPNASNSSAYSELQWYQRYIDKPDSHIGTTPVVDFKTQLKFVLWIENFDDQTDIFAVLTSGEGSKATIPHPIRNTYKKKHVTETKSYSESELVNFTCTSGDSQVGWIDPTGNRITTYEKANHSQKFHKEDNGSIFCCLRYVTQDTILNRYIDDCTLIYEEPSDQHTPNPVPEQSTPKSTSTTTLKTHYSSPATLELTQETTQVPLTVVPLPKPNQNNTVQTQKPKPSDNLEDLEKTDHLNGSPASDKTKYYVIIASVAGAILIASLVYVIVKKCSRKGSDPEVALQLEETYATTDMLYAELDMKPSNAPPPASAEETPYAQIIGVLRPVSENEKK